MTFFKRKTPVQDEFFSTQEVIKLLIHIKKKDNHELFNFVLVMYCLGLTIDELISLEFSEIPQSEKYILIISSNRFAPLAVSIFVLLQHLNRQNHSQKLFDQDRMIYENFILYDLKQLIKES